MTPKSQAVLKPCSNWGVQAKTGCGMQKVQPGGKEEADSGTVRSAPGGRTKAACPALLTCWVPAVDLVEQVFAVAMGP